MEAKGGLAKALPSQQSGHARITDLLCGLCKCTSVQKKKIKTPQFRQINETSRPTTWNFFFHRAKHKQTTKNWLCWNTRTTMATSSVRSSSCTTLSGVGSWQETIQAWHRRQWLQCLMQQTRKQVPSAARLTLEEKPVIWSVVCSLWSAPATPNWPITKPLDSDTRCICPLSGLINGTFFPLASLRLFPFLQA